MLQFIINYSTSYGQEIFIKIRSVNKPGEVVEHALPMVFLDNQHWIVNVGATELELSGKLHYHYELYENGQIKTSSQQQIEINLKKLKSQSAVIHDQWLNQPVSNSIFETKPFVQLFKSKIAKKNKKNTVKSPTHLIRIIAPELQSHHVICLTGSTEKLGNWSVENPYLLKNNGDHWIAKINGNKETAQIEFKVGIYDTVQKEIVFYEKGDNRTLLTVIEKDVLQILNILPDLSKFAWKGAGLNIQLSSIKTNRSWGTGDFTDLFLVTDWCKSVGIKLVQLLPLNDTTSTGTEKDSYPYSAISAFALHPNFLNVQKMAIANSIEFSEELQARITALNEGEVLDYEEVFNIKQIAIELLYQQEKQYFKDDLDWFEFFELNRSWLQPYAAFCYLRDKYNTADYTKWKSYQKFDEDLVHELTSSENKDYDKIAIHYFTQYHLHLQLKDAADYAHKNGLVLKADLPIGVGRFSIDTWMYPHLFNIDQQAGAPPDAFATKGQNWGFPTYNWSTMAVDNYAWWRQRMEQLSVYFDAVRIDHILGFFRIWSIPLHAVEGILGRFVPAHPFTKSDLELAGISFDEHRYCKPFITNDILYQLFGEKADWVRNEFLDNTNLLPAFDTQQKIEAYFETNPTNAWAKQGLFDLLTNVLLIKDENPESYHLRINLFDTSSFKNLGQHEQNILHQLYHRYFFNLQNELWKAEGIKKINALKNASNNMLLCGEDLGMVPDFVPSVLHDLQILSLQVERMPKRSTEHFSSPSSANYDSVITPSTHDMSTIRGWWEENRNTTQLFYNESLGHYGQAPTYCEPWIAKEIVEQHLYSPAIWSVFLWQDLLAMDDKIRRESPEEERMNIPANPNHIWNYRMHINVEELIANADFTALVKDLVLNSGRA